MHKRGGGLLHSPNIQFGVCYGITELMNPYNLEEVAVQKSLVVSAAQELLDGKTGLIACARRLVQLRPTVTRDDFDPDFLPFVAIASETDHLPVGEERSHWAATALAAKDLEIQQVEDLCRQRLLAACHVLIARFGRTT